MKFSKILLLSMVVISSSQLFAIGSVDLDRSKADVLRDLGVAEESLVDSASGYIDKLLDLSEEQFGNNNPVVANLLVNLQARLYLDYKLRADEMGIGEVLDKQVNRVSYDVQARTIARLYDLNALESIDTETQGYIVGDLIELGRIQRELELSKVYKSLGKFGSDDGE